MTRFSDDVDDFGFIGATERLLRGDLRCPECLGTGELEIAPELIRRRDQPAYRVCDVCHGTGRVQDEE